MYPSVTDMTDYKVLEKCYNIWICRDDIPKKEQYSISFYEMTNTKNIGNCKTQKENYDLLKLVVIRLGEKVYNGEKGSEGYDLLHFLSAIMYPHKEDFMDTISEYIDFSGNEELWAEGKRMDGLGQSVFEEGIGEGIKLRDEDLIMKKHNKGVSPKSIADFLEISVEKVNEVILKKALNQ